MILCVHGERRGRLGQASHEPGGRAHRERACATYDARRERAEGPDHVAFAPLGIHLADAAAHVRKDGGGVAEQIQGANQLVQLQRGFDCVVACHAVEERVARVKDLLQAEAVEGHSDVLERDEMTRDAHEGRGRVEPLQFGLITHHVHLHRQCERCLVQLELLQVKLQKGRWQRSAFRVCAGARQAAAIARLEGAVGAWLGHVSIHSHHPGLG